MKTILTALLLCIAIVSTSFGATYNGKSIDGKKYSGTAKDGKVIYDVRVEFNGRYATVYTGKRTFEVRLVSEVVDDPHHVEALDGDKQWVLSITDRLD